MVEQSFASTKAPSAIVSSSGFWVLDRRTLTAPPAPLLSASSVKQPADSSLNENLHLEGLPLHGQRLGFNEPA